MDRAHRGPAPGAGLIARMTFHEYVRVDRADLFQRKEPTHVTRMEKFANNLTTIVIARAAMIVTPFLLSFFIWLVWQVLSDIKDRLAALEREDAHTSSVIQDHESRLTFGRAQGQAFESQAKENFTDIGNTLKDITAQINAMNGSVIRLQTTIENRLPPRSSAMGDGP